MIEEATLTPYSMPTVQPRGAHQAGGCTWLHVQVRDAGEEAWLGKEAPEDPDLDIPQGEAPLLMLPPATSQQPPSSALKQRPAQEEDDPRNPLGFGELAQIGD